MSETDKWLDDYGESHRDIRFPGVYWVSVLLLVLGTIGLLWSLPVPAEFEAISPVLNWGSAFLMASVVYYFIISLSLAIGMLPFVFGVAAFQIWLEASPYSGTRVAVAMFGVALAGLYLGHLARGGLRAVLADIQMMMIGPVWVLSNIYRRFRIPF